MTQKYKLHNPIGTALLLAMFVLTDILPATAARRAVVFGIGQYEDPSWRQIHGDKDAILVTQMLKENGFRDITVLTNQRATKRGMAQALLDLRGRCVKGDIVYIHYSGHGQLMTDLDGDESERWGQRKHAQWDESWIPYDAYMTYGKRDDGGRHFCDDDVERFLAAIRKRIGSTGQLYVVIDACHSGDATRGAEDEEIARGIDTPFVIPRQTDAKTAPPRPEQWLTISACKPYQLCFEHKGGRGGKLTNAICRLGARFFTMSPAQLQDYLNKYMEDNPGRLPQNPVVSGKR